MERLFVPGRLCLFGEHSDWAGSLRSGDAAIAPGACIISGTDQGITAEAKASDDFEMRSRLPDGSEREPFRVAMRAEALDAAARAGEFCSYAAGVAAEVWERYRAPGLAITEIATDLPIGRGLSSSAAACVLTARAFNVVHGLGLDVRAEMDLAYRGELRAGSQCGRMDQACAYGGSLLLLGFDREEMSVELLRPAATVHLLIVDLCHTKDTRRILADLHRAFSAPDGPLREPLRAALGASNLDLIARARAALESGDARGVGELMTQAQRRFNEMVAPACAELAALRLHALLSHPAVRDLAWGGKGVGSQGDGAAQVVCRGAEERDALAKRLTVEGLRCLPLTVKPVGS
jgi:mevalonate kinase